MNDADGHLDLVAQFLCEIIGHRESALNGAWSGLTSFLHGLHGIVRTRLRDSEAVEEGIAGRGEIVLRHVEDFNHVQRHVRLSGTEPDVANQHVVHDNRIGSSFDRQVEGTARPEPFEGRAPVALRVGRRGNGLAV